MVKSATTKCILFSLLSTPFLNAGDYKSFKLRSLGAVTKVESESKIKKEFILDKINELVGDDIDLSLFDRDKEGWSVYAKISKVSRLGVRFNY
jgi:hypothetical protein